MANNGIGPKRLVVGAHHGLKEWLVQRVTAIIMAAYTIILLICFLGGNNFSYEGWAGMFAQQWFKLASFVAFLALFYHAWVGMREIVMDYAHAAGVRLCLYIVIIVWLVGCVAWTAQILWRV